ncbi:MAG: AMP-binding protein, partial [Planctomycetota bacterium]|nr:AMP-binding protein [Planctomycetota bacterium]
RGLLLLLHHVAVDDPSLRLLVEEIAEGLRGTDDGAETADDRAERWTLTDEGRREAGTSIPDAELRWWRDRLETMPARLDLRPTGVARTRERRRSVVITGEPKAQLDAAGPSSGGGRSGFVLHAVRAAMARVGLTGDGDLAVGLPMSLRDRPGLERTVGMFLNTLPVPVAADDEPADIARAIRETRRRRGVPYERMVREAAVDLEPLPGRSPWLDLVVGVVEEDRGGESELDWRVAPTGESPFPILIVVRFETERIRIELDVDPAWIPAEDADAQLAALHAALLLRGSGSAADDRSIVRGPGRRPSVHRTLPEFVEATTEAHPEREALRDGPRSWTYRELSREARGLAGALLSEVGGETADDGSLAGSPIAILGHPSGDTAISVLATMLAGGAAMPLSSDLPERRMQDLLRRAVPKAIVVSSEGLLDRAARVVAAAGIDVPLLRSVARVHETRLPEPSADRACYVLFTSGSTGEPKAVRMHHAGLLGLIEHERGRTSDAVAARTAQFAPLGFDVAFQELFSTWASGGAVVVVPSEVRRDPFALRAFIEGHGVTRIHLPPLVLRALAANAGDGFPDGLVEVVCAGEALRIDDSIRRAASLGGGRLRLVNQYGPTETHVATHLDLGTHPAAWPDLPRIGRPIDGVEIRIENDRGEVVRPGESGELVIGGDAVALGYLDGDSGGFESAANPLRRYRTGDRARIDRDGVIEYLGRGDRQVKISGYRVEPEEIEAVLAGLDGVEDAAVVAIPRDGTPMSADSALVAFAVGPQDEETLSGLLARLRDRLPPWMVPARLRGVETLPRSRNGKIDRTALTHLASSLPITGHDFGAGWTATDVLARLGDSGSAGDESGEVDRTTLGRLGIDSLAAIRLQTMLVERHGVEIPIADLRSLDVEGLRHRIGADCGSAVDPGPTRIELASGGAPATAESPVAADGWKPLDPLVRDVLAEDALAPEGAFHLAWTIRFPCEIPIEEIARRLALVRRRHPTLRTCRRADLGERTVPVDESAPTDLEAFPARPDEELLGRVLRHPLRVADGIPWRAATWNDVDGGTTLVVVLHHAAVDGRTAKSIIDEIVLADEAAPSTTHPNAAAPTLVDPEDDAWWIDRLSKGLGDAELPEFDFQQAGVREVAFHHRGGRTFRLAAARAAAVGLAPIAPALVAWGLILGRAAGRKSVVIGVPFATDLNDA